MDSSEQEGIKGRFIIFDFLVSAVAAILNAIVLVGVIRARLNLKGYKYFLISLSFSDLYACFVNIGSYSIQVAGVPGSSELSSAEAEAAKHCWVQIFRSLQIVSFTINMFTLCGMSVDHFIGILHPFQYSKFMRQRNISAIIICIWMFSFAFGFSDYVIATILALVNDSSNRASQESQNSLNCAEDSSENLVIPEEIIDVLTNLLANHSLPITIPTTAAPMFSGNRTTVDDTLFSCQIQDTIMQIYTKDETSRFRDVKGSCIFASNGNNIWLESAVMSLALVCFIFLLVCYGRIFIEIFLEKKLSQRSIRRLIITTVLLLGAFIVAWMPVLCFELAMLIFAKKDAGRIYSDLLLVHTVLNSLMFSYPLMDPLIYAARLSSVRRAILLLLRDAIPFLKIDRLRSLSVASSHASVLAERPSQHSATGIPFAYIPNHVLYSEIPVIDADAGEV